MEKKFVEHVEYAAEMDKKVFILVLKKTLIYLTS